MTRSHHSVSHCYKTSRNLYSARLTFQVWRARGEDRFTLVNQTHVTDVQKSVDLELDEFSLVTFDLEEEDQIPVRAGDVLGLYFPGKVSISYNPITL